MKFLILTFALLFSLGAHSNKPVFSTILYKVKKDANKSFEIALSHQKQEGEIETEEENMHRYNICMTLQGSETCLHSATNGMQGRACSSKWEPVIKELQSQPIEVKSNFSQDMSENFNNELDLCKTKESFREFGRCLKWNLIEFNQLLQGAYYCTNFD